MVDIQALRQRIAGMLQAPEETMRAHVTPVPPAMVVVREHVLPLLVASAACVAVLSFLFPIHIGGMVLRPGLTDVAILFVFRVVGSLVVLWILAGLAALLSQMFGGSRNFNAAFTLLGLSMTPLFIAEALFPLPVLGPLLGLAGLVYSFVLMYRTTPIALHLPQEHRGKHLVLFIMASMLLSFLLMSLLLGPVGAPGSL
ncbi:MAG: YIP1 family protein [Rhodospirillaceae bacterium]|nr:YIP1 family protein [Rhodospirillaceae bacterium]MCA8933440.1 YIP1 family protein [Rhodospirillaceae bacterium]